MTVAIHQPNYLPYLGFIDKISRVDTYVILDTVQYVRRGDAYHNRNRIKTARGPKWLTVPVIHNGNRDQKICDVSIQNSEDWPRKHWRTILTDYSKAPYFSSYEDFFELSYSMVWTRLAELNEMFIRYLLEEFKISVEIKKTSDLDVEGKATDLIMNICEALDEDVYLSGKNGMEYLELDRMRNRGISVIFQEFKHPVYSQCYENLGFIPNLSCIDMLFNCGENSMKILRESNPL